MNFMNEILSFEKDNTEDIYITRIGTIPILLTAVHTMNQERQDGTIKKIEPYTKAIVRYICSKLDCFYFIKLKDTRIDSNSLEIDEFKEKLYHYVKNNNIKLVIDIHGANKDRDFDVEFGNLNNLSTDFTTINELKESFIENGIHNIELNNPFKGGGITQYIYANFDIDVVQIEINGNYRNINNYSDMKKIIDSIIDFIKKYNNYIEK